MEEFRAMEHKDSALSLLAMKAEEGGHKPRKLGSFWKLENERKWILPGAYRKECSTATT